ncbi:MAG: prolipoprotein diacylglyceryl transferase [Terriglobia bacterium]
MFPKLFEHSWFVIHTYGFLLALGFVAGLYVSARAAEREKLNPAKVYDLGLYIALSSLVGAKLLMILTEFKYYSENPTEIFSLSTLRSGGVYYGGFLAAAIVGIALVHHQKLPVWKMTDIFSPGIALGQSIGRLGCLAAGCCYGRPTHSSLGVTFKNPYSHDTVGVPLNIPLHPAQLYEAVTNLIIFCLLWRALRKKKFDGQVFILYLLLYSVSRFVIEFFRGDPERGFLFDGLLSTSQFISLILIGCALGLYVKLKSRPLPSPVK